MIAFLLAILLLAICIEIYFRTRPVYLDVARKIDGPPVQLFFLAMKFLASLTMETTFGHLRQYAQTFGQTYRFYAFGRLSINVIRAKEVEIYLSGNRHMDKGQFYKFFSAFLGEGLLISKGDKWSQRRKILTPAFHFNILQQFLRVFHEESEKLVDLLNSMISTKGEDVNLPPITSRFTLNTICETSMGVKLDSMEEPDEYRRNIYTIGKLLISRILKPWIYLDLPYKLLGYKREIDRPLIPIHNFTRKIIRQRRQRFHTEGSVDFTHGENIYETKKRRYAMLDTLLAAEADGLIDTEGIREEVDTFMFEGHDTTSAALTFIFLLLAHHPDVQERVFQEIEYLVKANPGEVLTMAQLSELSYTDRVIKECLRLYPPVPLVSRETSEEFILFNCKIPIRTMSHIHIFDLHRDPEQFPDPERFDPDRFLPENVENRHPFAYVPFSAGPRNCIGQKFALLEIKAVLQHVLMAFRLSPVTKREDVVFTADLVLRTRDPVLVKFNRRVGKCVN
ncbi:probable cytochrome P450 4ac1 [Phlebotomus argentipes]|uniref:probable cytochrome P450 4ac1 n=1 Tax=Phlebotomus argentipes TaxID=94469 RepID=UPI002892FA26|nr:probable cytochrome P450 4ac1 [Phlebotomus argentipes]